jgi:urease accessory protein
MIKAIKVLAAGTWQSEAADTATLDETARHRRRVKLVTDQGRDFLLDLAEATLLADGDALELEDGTLIAVKAKPERLYEVRAGTGLPADLARLAWHIGNRHLPASIAADRILIRQDHVIRTMLEGLGAVVAEIEAPFHPEGGAYGQAGTHAHHGQHGHRHDDKGAHERHRHDH